MKWAKTVSKITTSSTDLIATMRKVSTSAHLLSDPLEDRDRHPAALRESIGRRLKEAFDHLHRPRDHRPVDSGDKLVACPGVRKDDAFTGNKANPLGVLGMEDGFRFGPGPAKRRVEVGSATPGVEPFHRHEDQALAVSLFADHLGLGVRQREHLGWSRRHPLRFAPAN